MHTQLCNIMLIGILALGTCRRLRKGYILQHTVFAALLCYAVARTFYAPNTSLHLGDAVETVAFQKACLSGQVLGLLSTSIKPVSLHSPADSH